MNIIGPDALVFGVDDLAACRQYLLDYGLDEVGFDPVAGGSFAALDGTSITLRRSADPRLPPLPPSRPPCWPGRTVSTPPAAVRARPPHPFSGAGTPPWWHRRPPNPPPGR